MNSLIWFLPAVICLLVAAFGFLCVIVVCFLPRKKATPPRRSVWAKVFFAVGAAAVLFGFLGAWVTGFSVGWMGNPPREWSDGQSPELQALVRKRCVPFLNRGKGTGLAVAVVRGTNASVMAFGRPALTSFSPANGDTLFEIGSITKTFTAITLAREIERGAVRLDQPIQELLPPDVKLPKDARGITLRHLTTHTSGFPRLPGNQSPLRNFSMLL